LAASARGGQRGRGSMAAAARRWEGKHGHSALIAKGTRVREDWSSHEWRVDTFFWHVSRWSEWANQQKKSYCVR
jgi:hypothetical protein